jgi:hypothetical protein
VSGHLRAAGPETALRDAKNKALANCCRKDRTA